MTISRREAIGIGATLVGAAVIVAYCAQDDEPLPQPQPQPGPQRQTKVKRLSVLHQATAECDKSALLWSGSADTVVHVTIMGGGTCSAALSVGNTPVEPQAGPGQQVELSVEVPASGKLYLACVGSGEGTCNASITATEPVLTDVTAGPVEEVELGPTVIDPEQPPDIGTIIHLTCGRVKVLLWQGPSSYVTVRYTGARLCEARIISHGDNPSHETTGPRFTCYTFGPITSLEGSCLGAPDNGHCQFQVMEVTELPA